MTKEELIRMAREAGFEIGESYHSESIFNPHTDDDARLNAELERFAALVAAAEREACAKVCESQRPSQREFDHRFFDAATVCASVIRARGQK